jgi:hypothetical protein
MLEDDLWLEMQLRAFILFMFMLIAPIVAKAEVVGAGTAAEEKLQCTWPSFGLLSMNDAGSSAGGLNSFIAGLTVYLQSAGRYVSCEAIKWNNIAFTYEQPIFRFFNRMMAPKPRLAPQQQQQQPAQK